jgi:hypothetical protein
MLKSQTKERLLKLADVLDNFKTEVGHLAVPPGKYSKPVKSFDMTEFVRQNYDIKINQSFCGTAACAWGIAGLHPWFRRRGVSVDENGTVIFKGNFDFDAAQQFFGLPSYEVEELYSNPYLAKDGRKTYS